jgi:hypothetical protein
MQSIKYRWHKELRYVPFVARPTGATHDDRQMPAGLLDNARLAVLSDALEEAGCADAPILGHLRGRQTCAWCRGAGAGLEMFQDIPVWVDECSQCGGAGWTPVRVGHARGCFVVDALLGRE